jgi:nucleoside-diphosphate-sugar epimerase/quercetin dioxygenase-like cupin family protein
MEKIVITGGLGYIGSELCKLYSGETRFKNITVIDQRFCSEKVKQLRDWGINFFQACISDEVSLKKHLSDADVVIHLAGITDVAYVKTQENKEQDELIRKTGVDGTVNIIKNIKDSCKIIFPSTHVVYEGFPETKTDIDESEPPTPVLTYSTVKFQSEKDLIASGKNYVILRLGSVYGYSTDSTRIGIMPNLFSKIASQNATIKLFSGGVQLKSLVPVVDVARFMKFVADTSTINKEVFHVAKETMTVKEVANLCKTFNPSLNIIETNDEIPNLGYTISNKKLLSTGFKFQYSIEKCIKEMIENWSKKNIKSDLEYIDRGGNEYVDSRGKIVNYELTEPINLIGYIESKEGTVRANHYHPIQEQKCLLIKGQYISVIKDLSVPNAPIETRVINVGDIAIIKPNVAHAMVFTQDSVFLNLVRGEREHENYGVTHTLPYILVDENMRDNLLKTYQTKCRSCGNIHLDRVVSLGTSPLANNLKNSETEYSEVYPLEVNYCSNCHNCQLSVVVSPEKMFDNYLYVSSTASTFRKHFEEAAQLYMKQFNLNSTSLVIDIGSNDGIGLKTFKENGIRVLGIDPAKNIAELANKNGIPTLNEYFSDSTATYILQNYGKAKLITASNVFAHSDKLVEIANASFSILEDGGSFVVEVQYLLDTINDMTFDNVYHEHVNYWSVTSINNFFNKLGFTVYKVEHIDTHGGSIRVYVNRGNSAIDSSVSDFIQKEKGFGLTEKETYAKFGNNVETIKKIVNQNIQKLKEKYKIVAAYGSPAKATTSLNYFGINNSYIDYTIEDNELKNGKFIPGVNIPIKNKEHCLNNMPNVIIVLAWNFFELIKENNKNLLDNGVKFINIKELQLENFEP